MAPRIRRSTQASTALCTAVWAKEWKASLERDPHLRCTAAAAAAASASKRGWTPVSARKGNASLSCPSR